MKHQGERFDKTQGSRLNSNYLMRNLKRNELDKDELHKKLFPELYDLNRKTIFENMSSQMTNVQNSLISANESQSSSVQREESYPNVKAKASMKQHHSYNVRTEIESKAFNVASRHEMSGRSGEEEEEETTRLDHHQPSYDQEKINQFLSQKIDIDTPEVRSSKGDAIRRSYNKFKPESSRYYPNMATGPDTSHLQSHGLVSSQSGVNQFSKMKIFDKSNYMSYDLVLPKF